MSVTSLGGPSPEHIGGTSDPSQQITGDVKPEEQQQRKDYSAESKAMCTIKGLTFACNGIDVTIAEPSLGNPKKDPLGASKTDSGKKADKAADTKKGPTIKAKMKKGKGKAEKAEEGEKVDGEKKADEASSTETADAEEGDARALTEGEDAQLMADIDTALSDEADMSDKEKNREAILHAAQGDLFLARDLAIANGDTQFADALEDQIDGDAMEAYQNS